MSVTEQLLQLNTTKQAIKTAIENKGQDLTDIPFTQYAEKIAQIAGGKKFTTGTVFFTSKLAQQTITHNLGVKPSIFLLYAKISKDEIDYGVEGEAGNQGWDYGYRYFDCRVYSDILTSGGNGAENGTLSQVLSAYRYAGNVYYRFNNSIANSWSANEQTIKTGYAASYYFYKTNIEYEWIAIE